MGTITAFLSVIKKDILVWKRSPVGIVVILLPPLLILGLLALAGASVSSEPVALVVQNPTGHYSIQMADSIRESQQFRVVDAGYVQAQRLFQNLEVAGIVVIPASFDSNISSHSQATVSFVVNNVDADSTNDLRRGIAIAMMDFDSNSSVPSSSSRPSLSFEFSYLKPPQVSILQFQSVGVLVFLMLTSGLTGGSLAMTREWENKTIRELLLAPVSRSMISFARVISNTLTSLVPVFLIVAMLFLSGYLVPNSPLEWVAFVATIVLTSLFTSALGVALANVIKKGPIMIGISINLSFLLFFLTGGLVAVPYLPSWAQRVSALIPLSYAASALDQTSLYSSMNFVAGDLVVLSVSAIVALVVCAYASLTIGSRA